MEGRTRVCARVLVLDAASRVLLFQTRDVSGTSDGERYWFLPGGGLEAGETVAEAAAREVREETGWSGLHLVGPLCSQEFDLGDNGTARHQVEHFFTARTDSADLRTDGWTELERSSVTAWRWWTTDELLRHDVTYFPEDLVELVGRARSALPVLP